MSDFPGYPSPFSTWNLSTTARTVFPIGSIPVPGLVSGISGFLEPGYFPGPASVPDPLAPFLPSPYRPPPPVASRFLPNLTDLPALGVEPLYGCGLREPRGIAHSPNFLFSQNPSPLTFDQIYRSGSNSVSPVSQYRNQFDQRYVNSRLLAPGRLSEPLVRKPTSLLNVKNKEEKHQQGKEEFVKSNSRVEEKINSSFSKEKSSESKVSNQERSKRIWNPFEAVTNSSNERSKTTSDKSKVESITSDFKLKDSDHLKASVECEKVNEDNKKSISEVSDNVKQLPRQPIPQYPVKPIPLYDSQRLALSSSVTLDHIGSIPSVSSHNNNPFINSYSNTVSQTDKSLSNLTVNSNGQLSSAEGPKSEKSEEIVKSNVIGGTVHIESKKVEKDLNQNLQVENNNNHSKVDLSLTSYGIQSNCYDVNVSSQCTVSVTQRKPIVSDSKSAKIGCVNEINSADVIIVSDTEESCPDKTELSEGVRIDENRNIESRAYQHFQSQNNEVGSFCSNSDFVNNQNCYFQLQLQIEDDHSSVYVPYGSSLENQSVDSTQQPPSDSSPLRSSFVSELHQDYEPLNDVTFGKEFLTSSNGSIEDCDSSGVRQHSPSKSSKSNALLSPRKSRDTLKKKELKDELSVLSHQVNEIRKRRNSANKDTVSPRLKSPSCEQFEGPTSDKTDSDKTPVITRKVINRCRYPRKMAAGSGALTVMKNSEDSLSASISSSQISESDSDTQLSTDNADKLFTESQSDNTHTMYSDNQVSEQSTYISPDTGNGNCDNQFYKSNNPQMCQSESDNQKPYLCVQEQNSFNEKSQILPPYNCYTPNQSTNVLPAEEESFQSHHEEEISNFHQQSTQEVLESTMDYDENSVMSESNTNVECDPQLGMPHVSDPASNKSSLLDSIQNTVTFLAPNDDEWEFLHSKQYIDNIYYGGCEPVKNEDGIRESDSPKTFIDLDTTTKEKKAQEKMKNVPFMKGALGGKHYGKSLHHQGYPSGARMSHNMYGNQYDNNYSGMGGHRWNNYNRNGSDGSMSHQSKMGNERDGNQYDQNQYRSGYQPNYYPMNHGQNGGDKMYNQSSYHGNEYVQNDSSNYYNQGQSVKGYQGNYVNDGRYDSNYYQNKPSNDYSSQGNMYPPTSTEMPGSRYSNQNYAGNQGGYSQHYTQQSPSHSGSNSMVQYSNTPNPNFSLPRNASPGGSDFPEVTVPVKKKRGRKRKADKEPHDDSKPKPNTIVVASTNLGPLIDVDNPDCPIETYDYNHQIETIFNYTVDEDLCPLAVQFLEMEQRLCKKMMPIKYGHPVNVIYCPLTYAFQTHRDFISKFLTSERPILFLGMNPGPYGMSQNGCPFGEANVVRDWLKITGDIYKPEIEHPKKPVTGLACTRNEVSGARFWGLFQKICRVPENFFKHSYVHNFCPFAYMSESGKNITPPQLEHSELDQINEACDAGLVELVKLLNTRVIIAVGKFVQQRASKALHNAGIMNVKVECILHPSPINPHANKGWEQIVAKQLIEMNVMQYLNPDVDDVQRQIEEWEKVAQTNASSKIPIPIEPE